MRYFFNAANGHYDRDTEGTELESAAAARVMAVRYAADILRDHPTIVWVGEDFRIEVKDETGLMLFTIIIFGVDGAMPRE
jgi:hypothetical protein